MSYLQSRLSNVRLIPKRLSIVAVCAVAFLGLAAVILVWYNGTRLPAGISISGPPTVNLGVAHNYTISVVADKSYKQATVEIVAPGANISEINVANLSDRKKWTKTEKMTFTTTAFQNTRNGISVLVVSPRTKKPPYAHILMSKTFSIKLVNPNNTYFTPLTTKPTPPPPSNSL